MENEDRLCTTEILHQEFECHRGSKEAGLACLRRQLTGDELLVWTIETFTFFYEKTFAQRVVLPFLGLFPLFLSISSFVYDYYSDIELTLEYFQKSTFAVDDATANPGGPSQPIVDSQFRRPCHYADFNSTHAIILKAASDNCSYTHTASSSSWPASTRSSVVPYAAPTSCMDIERTPEEYRTAFVTNIVCFTLPLLIFFAMCARELLPAVHRLDARATKALPGGLASAFTFVLFPMWLLVAFVCSPFFILFVAARQVYYKFRHRRAKHKNLFRKQLQKSEYLWGISRTAEAGLESCGQLILQVWLLSSDFKSLSEESFWALFDKTYNGVVFFLSFSYKAADENEKSLGKICMSLVALVFGVSGCYRTLKRGAVKMSHTFFIYISLFLQVFARIFSLALYFFAVHSFLPMVPVLLAAHFAVVFAIKWSFERARHTHGMMAWLVSGVNVFASSLVYVRIVPIEKQRPGCRAKAAAAAGQALQHSTFFMQSLFFLLVLTENILLASVPLFYTASAASGTNRAVECVGRDSLRAYAWAVVGLSVASWGFHTMYYKYMGHPWSAINGPNFARHSVEFFFHCCGKERLFHWTWKADRDGEDDDVGCCSNRCRVTCDSDDESNQRDIF